MSPTRRPQSLVAVSVDLDEVHHYFAIHGRVAPDATALHAGYDVGLGRLVDFARGRSISVTLFAVGEDLARSESAASLADAARRGHLVENHSFGHRYDLTRLPPDAIRREIAEGADAIERVTGRRPLGFRAPGYTITDPVFDALEQLGVAFDSSVFPCPPYYLAKAAVLGSLAARGLVSRSILDTPRVLLAPRRPYRPGKPWHRRGDRKLIELPVQVTPMGGLPFIGTSIALAGPTGARVLAHACAGEPLVNLELHLMDFLDASDGIEALVAYQPELRVPLARRLEALGAALDVFADRGAAFVTLEEASRAFS